MSNQDYKKALVQITSHSLQELIDGIPEETFLKDVDELEQEANPTPLQKKLKVRMQYVIEKALMNNESISKAELVRGVTHINNFDRNILPKKKLMAWLLAPSVKDDIEIEYLYEKGRKKLEEIISMNIKNKYGEIDTNKAKLVMQAYKMLQDRVHPIVNKQQIHQVSEKYDRTEEKKLGIEDKIKLLEAELGKKND